MQAITGVSDSNCIGFWLIGKQNGKYVCYVNVDTLKNALSGGYQYNPKIYRDKIVVVSTVRNRGEDLARTGKMSSFVDEVTLFWDDEAQWFGIKPE